MEMSPRTSNDQLITEVCLNHANSESGTAQGDTRVSTIGTQLLLHSELTTIYLQ